MFATEFGLVVAQQQWAETVSLTLIQGKISGREWLWLFFSLRGISAIESFYGSLHSIFSGLVKSHSKKTAGATETHILAILAPGTESTTMLVLRQCLLSERIGAVCLVGWAWSKSPAGSDLASGTQSHWFYSPQSVDVDVPVTHYHVKPHASIIIGNTWQCLVTSGLLLLKISPS